MCDHSSVRIVFDMLDLREKKGKRINYKLYKFKQRWDKHERVCHYKKKIQLRLSLRPSKGAVLFFLHMMSPFTYIVSNVCLSSGQSGFSTADIQFSSNDIP